jgi:hypothetical protein
MRLRRSHLIWTWVVVLGLLLLGSQTPAHASAPVTGGGRANLVTAAALFSNAPPQPVVGQVYTDVYVEATSSSQSSNSLFIQSLSYYLDENGTANGVDVLSGEATGPAVRVEVDGGKLSSTSVAGTVQVGPCADADCKGERPVEVQASWSATGTTTRTNEVYRQHTPSMILISRTRGSYRTATASGTLDGADLGASPYGFLFSGTYSGRIICKVGCT